MGLYGPPWVQILGLGLDRAWHGVFSVLLAPAVVARARRVGFHGLMEHRAACQYAAAGIAHHTSPVCRELLQADERDGRLKHLQASWPPPPS